MSTVLSAIFGGLAGGAISPIILDWWRDRKHAKWAEPRRALLLEKLEKAKGEGWVSLERLKVLVGLSSDDCRSLLIGLGARGGWLKGNREGWALLSRQPLDKTGMDVDEE